MKQLFRLIFLFLILLPVVTSCKKDPRKSEAQKIVAEWVGKTIRFPDAIPYSFMGKDTLYLPQETPYKVLVYTDSTGCTGCKAQFYKWNAIGNEIQDDFQDKVSLHFVFHPKDEKELVFLFRRDNFQYPVFIDRNNEMEELNHFPQESNYQCFLLDNENKVLLVGSPVLNSKIWDLYKQVILGEAEALPEKQSAPLTGVEVEQSEMELKGMKKGEETLVTFVLKNTGENPLLIQDISSSCGCTVPEWDRHPVSPGKEAKITVKVTPEDSGTFNKSIRVACNTEGVIRLRVWGKVEP